MTISVPTFENYMNPTAVTGITQLPNYKLRA